MTDSDSASAPPAGSAGPEEFCSWCGKALDAADHAMCRRRLSLIDPPRYCARCARRMVVQVTPTGWTATCSRHGRLHASQ